jgi:hypothetical protein
MRSLNPVARRRSRPVLGRVGVSASDKQAASARSRPEHAVLASTQQKAAPVRGAPLQKGPQIMVKYVFSFRVPSDYTPNAGTPAEWQAWFGGLGSALVDVGNAVTDYASLGAVGGRDSRMVAYSVVSAEDMDSALALAKDCPVMRVGGGVEVGPVMEAAGS